MAKKSKLNSELMYEKQRRYVLLVYSALLIITTFVLRVWVTLSDSYIKLLYTAAVFLVHALAIKTIIKYYEKEECEKDVDFLLVICKDAGIMLSKMALVILITSWILNMYLWKEMFMNCYLYLSFIVVLFLTAWITKIMISSKFYSNNKAMTMAVAALLSIACITIFTQNVSSKYIVIDDATDVVINIYLALIAILWTAYFLNLVLFTEVDTSSIWKMLFIFVNGIIIVGLGGYIITRIFYIVGDNNSLFSGVMAIYAAVIGGSLTLGGVAWSMKKQEAARFKI